MKAKRKDINQPELEVRLKKLGFSVTSLHALGKGIPDLLLGIMGINIVVEVKHDNAELTEPEKEWHRDWKGQVRIAQSAEEIVLYVANWSQTMKRKLDAVTEECDRMLAELKKTKGDNDEADTISSDSN